MIGNEGFIKIIDFGEAKIVDIKDDISANTVSVNE
jgi:hypothetical protein